MQINRLVLVNYYLGLVENYCNRLAPLGNAVVFNTYIFDDQFLPDNTILQVWFVLTYQNGWMVHVHLPLVNYVPWTTIICPLLLFCSELFLLRFRYIHDQVHFIKTDSIMNLFHPCCNVSCLNVYPQAGSPCRLVITTMILVSSNTEAKVSYGYSFMHETLQLKTLWVFVSQRHSWQVNDFRQSREVTFRGFARILQKKSKSFC